jgi:hypothetical protein
VTGRTEPQSQGTCDPVGIGAQVPTAEDHSAPEREYEAHLFPLHAVFDRSVAARYDKLAVRYEATVLGAVLNEWL